MEIKTFMDFCSGIGGGRLGLELSGLKCVGHSEIIFSSNATYKLFFGLEGRNYGDLMKIDSSQLPHFDMMIAGFPCQTFSIAGKRAGFNDVRGNIIYGLIKILKEREVGCFLLENVKGLVNHDKGRTFRVIQEELSRAGYDIYHSILNSVDFGVPQLRERVYIVGFRKDWEVPEFDFPQNAPTIYALADILHPDSQRKPFDERGATFQRYLANKYNNGKYIFEDLVQEDFTIVDTRHSDLRIYKDATPTLRTGRHGILYSFKGKLWKLTGEEALKLQGFREREVSLIRNNPVVSNNTLLSQAGNAMTVTVIEAISNNMIAALSGIRNKEVCVCQ